MQNTPILLPAAAPVSDGSIPRANHGLPVPSRTSIFAGRTLAGFSLVEVVLALGITSFSLLTILGLLPVGLNVLKEAGESSTRARIVQKLHGEILLMPFAKLEAQFDDQTLYFDEAGERVAGNDGSSAALYKVETQLISPRYPMTEQVSTTLDISSSLKAVELQFTKLYGDSASSESSIIWVPNSGG